MPITIIDKQFTYFDGSQKTFYESNAGDRVEIKLKVLEQILVASGGSNYLTFNLFDNTVIWGGGNWLNEGFRVGEVYNFRKYDSNGNFISGSAGSATVLTISGSNNEIIKFSDIPSVSVPNNINGEIVVIYQATDYRREEIIVFANHVQNNNSGNEFSLIDGEATGFRIDVSQIAGFPYLANNLTVPFTAFGKHSGQFKTIVELICSDETPTEVGYQINIGFVYYIKITTVQSGIYLPDQFLQNFCLKFYSKMEFARFVGEPFQRKQLIFNDEANNGWFNEPFNVGFSDAALIQGITEIGYDAPTNAQIKIQTSSNTTDVALGFSYIPTDESYYKNQIPDQSVFGMTISTTPAFALTNFVSPTNLDGANYVVNVTSVTNVSGLITINLTITPNAAFNDFISNREFQDQTFYVWARVENVNFLVFDGQLTSNPPIAGPIDMHSAIYYDHGQNVETLTNTIENGYEANLEDDLAFCGSFLLDIDANCESFLARIEAFNTVTNEEFTLSQTFFSFAGVPKIGGKYVLNQSSPVNSILPTTSVKQSAKLVLEPTLDTLTKYGVKIYFPFIYRWEYWLQQTNANNDFYPNNQTKNWVPYGNTGDWTLRLHLELNQNDLGYIYNDEIIIKDYDSDPEILQSIELFVNSTNQLANIVTIGELMRVEARHKLTDGTFWDPNTWGQITVEPFESATRYLLSTIVPFDNNVNNPLTPISGQFAQLTFPTPSEAKIVCYFDPNKINLTNGCKFTTKIKGCSNNVSAKQKVTTDDIEKVTTDDIIKEIS
jgi:hypothetical protein